MVSNPPSAAAPTAYVEFTCRIYDDGRRERFATVYEISQDGTVRPGPRRPEGRLGRFVADAVGEVERGEPRRRVEIESRAALLRRRHERR